MTLDEAFGNLAEAAGNVLEFASEPHERSVMIRVEDAIALREALNKLNDVLEVEVNGEDDIPSIEELQESFGQPQSIQPLTPRQFIMGGKACFTLQEGDQHFTYRINRWTPTSRPNATPRWYVQLGIGYQEGKTIGQMIVQGDRLVFQEQGIRRDAPSAALLIHFFKAIDEFQLVDPEVDQVYWVYGRITFMHAGRCCRCSRELTNPESIRMGIGPECAGRER